MSCAIFILVSAAAVQSAAQTNIHKVMPGTVASTVAPDPSFAAATSSSNAPRPIDARERIRWILEHTVGPESLAAGLVSAGWSTGFDSPKEYGTHWEGFGERYGMRLTGIATSNTMEAGLGAIWGEDPRYIRDEGASFGHRIGHAAKMTFLAENRDGKLMPAYARYIAVPGSNFLSNTWRPDSDATVNRAIIRTGLGFLGRFGCNTFDEFWPDVQHKMFHRGHAE
ncbi:MAG TPA: hypothetical protein VME17_08715 [Bryobacteraceae bacterium]|nr:hypothetical protein [Bryobacteraceae bacterium]